MELKKGELWGRFHFLLVFIESFSLAFFAFIQKYLNTIHSTFIVL